MCVCVCVCVCMSVCVSMLFYSLKRTCRLKIYSKVKINLEIKFGHLKKMTQYSIQKELNCNKK